MDFIDWSEWQEESWVIQVHTLLAIMGLLAGLYAMTARKGTARHKFMGRIFAALALAVALTSFFIHEIALWGPFSPIHLLSVATVWLVVSGVRAIRRGDVATHQNAMRLLFLSGFIVAGLFTLQSGRLPYEVFLERPLNALTGNEALAEGLPIAFPVLAIPLCLWIYIRGYRRASPSGNRSQKTARTSAR